MAQSNFLKKIAKQYELITTSFHESGHAIFALLAKIHVPLVYVFHNKKNNRMEGSCHYHIPDFSRIEDKTLFSILVEKEIGIKYAGLTAEKYHFKTVSGSDKFPVFLRDGSSNDTMSAAYLIRQHNIVPPGKKRYEYKKKKIKEILHVLQDNWNDVVLIAHSLFNKKKLSFQDLKNILTKKSDKKQFWKNQFKIIEKIFIKLNTLDEIELKSILLS